MWDIIRKTAVDTWDELVFMVVFNLIWVVSLLLIIPYPFATFGLFYTVYDVGQAKGIKFGTLFKYGKQYWKQAYIWGVINLIILAVLWLNLSFYAGIQSQWSVILRLFFGSLLLFWLALQLVMLPLYPRLVEPGFKLALRNSLVIVGRHPGRMFALVALTLVLLVLSTFIPIVGVVLSFSVIAMLGNNIVDVAINEELKRVDTGEQ